MEKERGIYSRELTSVYEKRISYGTHGRELAREFTVLQCQEFIADGDASVCTSVQVVSFRSVTVTVTLSNHDKGASLPRLPTDYPLCAKTDRRQRKRET